MYGILYIVCTKRIPPTSRPLSAYPLWIYNINEPLCSTHKFHGISPTSPLCYKPNPKIHLARLTLVRQSIPSFLIEMKHARSSGLFFTSMSISPWSLVVQHDIQTKTIVTLIELLILGKLQSIWSNIFVNEISSSCRS